MRPWSKWRKQKKEKPLEKKQEEERERGWGGHGTLHAAVVLEIYFSGSFKLIRVILEDKSYGIYNFLIITLSMLLINKRIKDKLKFIRYTVF